MLGAAVACASGALPAAAAEGPWFIPAPEWACLLPLDGVDCSGGGAQGMLADWTAPRDVRTESPVVGTRWDDIDFGGAARSAAFLGSGEPVFVRLASPGAPDRVDVRAHHESRGAPTCWPSR